MHHSQLFTINASIHHQSRAMIIFAEHTSTTTIHIIIALLSYIIVISHIILNSDIVR